MFGPLYLMGTYSRYPGRSFGIGAYFPQGVKWLLIINCAVFVLLFFLGLFDSGTVSAALGIFGLSALGFLHGQFWQIVTYMFLHAGFGHLVFNMLSLWMFGTDLEREWGTRRFLNFYLICGAGAGLCDVFAKEMFGRVDHPTVGASGAIYGILLAFGMLYPTRTVFYGLLFPIQAKYFVLIVGAFAFFSSFDPSSPVSNFAHLGGMLFGYLYLRFRLHRLDKSLFSFYQQWRRRRLQQKFKVYMRKQEGHRDRDPWVN